MGVIVRRGKESWQGALTFVNGGDILMGWGEGGEDMEELSGIWVQEMIRDVRSEMDDAFEHLLKGDRLDGVQHLLCAMRQISRVVWDLVVPQD
jgi:hypothetical protein